MLIDLLQEISRESVNAAAPTEFTIGTVTQTEPLEIVTQTGMQTLRESVLYLTEPVIEKKIPVLEHTHTVEELPGVTQPALEQITCLENGTPLPVEDGYIILNRALAVGDKVLLLRVMGGQMFLVLSRAF